MIEDSPISAPSPAHEVALDSIDDANAPVATQRPVELVAGWRYQITAWGEQMRRPQHDFTDQSPAQVRGQLRERLLPPLPATPWWGWVATVLVTALAAVMRLVDLNRPARIVFDETYYVRQAYSLLQLGYEGTWPEDSDADFAEGNFSGLSEDAGPIVHPSVGKWMIAIGLRIFGGEDIVGWRIIAALTGVVSVFLLIRIGRRLFGHVAFGVIAGLLLALDGVHLVMSRISILDIFVMIWALLGFYFLLLDRQWYRSRLIDRSAELLGKGPFKDPWGPKIGVRPWLIAAGISLGLATSVKWSGLYFVAVFGVMAVFWNLTARRAVGVKMWLGAAVMRDGIPAFLMLVPTAVLVYIASWIPWVRTSDGLFRNWAQNVNAVAENPVRTWMPDTLNSWVEYHRWMWDFHNGLTSEHSYMAKPLGWLVQQRPTSFAWQSIRENQGADLVCGSERCAAAILAVGNPVLWWGGVIALLVVVWWALKHRDWSAWAILGGYIAGYVPWVLFYSHRTIFNFYTVAFVPFVALAFAFALSKLAGSGQLAHSSQLANSGKRTDSGQLADPGTLSHATRQPWQDRKPQLLAVGIAVALVILAAWFFWPVWTSQWLPYEQWRLRMFLPSWI